MFEGRKKFEVEKITLATQDLDEFVMSPEVDMNKLSMAFVGGGQGGGKIGAEFCRLGYPLVAYNTCKEDLDDLEDSINGMSNRGYFKRIDLEGEGGAAKDRTLGKKAIKDNYELLKGELFTNEYVVSADFIWVCVALGGGTGNGSLTSVTKMISMVRSQAEKDIFRGGEYKPTIGVIAAIPDKTAKSRIKLNVTQALEDLEMLHDAGELGAVILLDNQKLINDFNKSLEAEGSVDIEKTWTTDGNNKVARILAELALTTSLKSSQMLDKAEMLDIWSTPGFMGIGKKELEDAWIVDECVQSELEDIPTELEKKSVIFEKMIKKSFSESVFVEGIDLGTALTGGMVVVSDGKIINSGDSKALEDVLSDKVLNSDTVESVDFGFIRTDLSGTVKQRAEGNKNQGKIFTMCVTKGAPAYIIEWFKQTVESRKKHIEAMEKVNASSGLQGLTDGLNMDSLSVSKKPRKTVSLGDMFGELGEMEKVRRNRAKNLGSLDDLFGSEMSPKSSSKENTEERRNELLDSLLKNN